MARPVRYFEPLWLDRHFKKNLTSLPSPEQDRRLREIEDLIRALAVCRHPCTDPFLAPWRPSPYHVSRITGLFEYRCRYPLRIIARWIEPHPEASEGEVLMVGVTLAHDHDRLKLLIASFRSDLMEGEER